MHTLKSLRCILLLLLLTCSSYAVPVVDQSQLDASAYMAAFFQTDLAQSFQQAASTIAGAEVFIDLNGGDTTLITIGLWDALPNAGGTLLASGQVANALAGTWATVWWPQLSIVPNQTYFLVFESQGLLGGLGGSGSNPYSRGHLFANTGYGEFPDFDYTFQTYSSGPSVSSVPEINIESAAIPIALLAITGLVLADRRRFVHRTPAC